MPGRTESEHVAEVMKLITNALPRTAEQRNSDENELRSLFKAIRSGAMLWEKLYPKKTGAAALTIVEKYCRELTANDVLEDSKAKSEL